MKFIQFLIICMVVCLCDCKVKSHDPAGQDVIEIGTPVQELPPGVEEEPSGEADDGPEDLETRRTSPRAQPSKDARADAKTRVASTSVKPSEKASEESGSQEEEARIEKELAEIYKDTDYKAETDPPKMEVNDLDEGKPIARQGQSFKFQPDTTDRQTIQRFRTSVDDIACNRRITQKANIQPNSSTASQSAMDLLQVLQLVLAVVLFNV